MLDSKIKLKYEDFKKLAEIMEKECKGGYIQLEIRFPVLKIRSTNTSQEDVLIKIWDADNHMIAKRTREERL